jgi:hypothetical protein
MNKPILSKQTFWDVDINLETTDFKYYRKKQSEHYRKSTGDFNDFNYLN